MDYCNDLWGVLEMPLPLRAQELTELKADVTEIWWLNSIKLSQASSCIRWLTWLLYSESFIEPPALHCTTYLQKIVFWCCTEFMNLYCCELLLIYVNEPVADIVWQYTAVNLMGNKYNIDSKRATVLYSLKLLVYLGTEWLYHVSKSSIWMLYIPKFQKHQKSVCSSWQ